MQGTVVFCRRSNAASPTAIQGRLFLYSLAGCQHFFAFPVKTWFFRFYTIILLGGGGFWGWQNLLHLKVPATAAIQGMSEETCRASVAKAFSRQDI